MSVIPIPHTAAKDTTSLPVRYRGQLNWRLAAASVAAVAVLTPAVYFWHQHQLNRVSTALLYKADQMEAEGSYSEASSYLYRYLQMMPTEDDRRTILTRLAETYDKSVTSGADKDAVIQWYYRALGAAPERTDLRNRLAELFLETKQYVLAQEEAEKVLRVHAEDMHAMRNKALARAGQYLQGRPLPIGNVVDELESVNDRDPGNLTVAEQLVALYRGRLPADDESRDKRADEVMDKLVQSNPDRQQAYLARYRYRVRFGLAGAEDDLTLAVAADPNNPEVVFAAAGAAQRRGDFHEAERRFRQTIEHQPTDYRGHLGLGDALIQLGRRREAVEVWRQALNDVATGRLPILIRLADAQLSIQQLSAAEETIAAISDSISRLAARGQEAQRDWAVASHGLLTAKLAIAREQYEDAVSVLRRVATTATAQGNQVAEQSPDYQAWLLLGKTYAELRRWEEAANSFERALQAAPQSNTARLWAARSWNAVGRHDQAILLCEQAVDRPPVPESIWLMLAELQMRNQLKLPPVERRWQAVSDVLQLAQAALPDSWEIQLLIATQLIASEAPNVRGEAMQALSAAESLASDSLPMWTRLIFLYDALEQHPDAERALRKVAILSDDVSLTNLYEAVLCARRGEYDTAINTLDQIDPSRDDLQVSIERIRLMVAYRQGDQNAARNVLLRRLGQEPDRIDALAQLAELAVFDRNWEEVERLVAKLHAIEGEEGVLWRFFRAQRLLEMATTAEGPEVMRAIDLSDQIRAKRPWWTGNQLLQARLAELQQRDTEAIDRYSNVLRAGLKQAGVYLRLVRLLHKQGRFVEADQWLEELQQQQPLDPQFLDLAWSTAPDRDRLQLALSVGRKNVQLHPSEAVARVWMGQMLLLAGRPEEAQGLIDEALALNPEDVASWTGLLSYYVRIGSREQALRALEVLQQHEDVSPGQRHWLAAQTYRRLGQAEQAKQFYEQALEHAPTHTDLLLDFARFTHPFDSEKAESMVREAIKNDAEHAEARRLLAMWLQGSGRADAQHEIESLLEPDQNNASDRRMEAVLRIRSGRPDDRIAARRLLESLTSAADGTLEDHELLASIYEQDGDVDRAAEHWQLLVKRPRPAARHLVGYIEFLMRLGENEAVQPWLEQLERQAPQSFSALRLRVKFLIDSGKSQQTEAIVEDYVRRQLVSMDKPAAEKRMLRQVAEMLESAGEYKASELRFNQLLERHPDEGEELAMFWVRNQQLERAAEFCLRAAQDEPNAKNGALLAKVLVHGQNAENFIRRSEDVLAAIQAKHPDDRFLLFAMANLKLKQGRTQDAIDALRHLTHVSPQHVLAWNNLAALLADQPGYQDEAMQCINQAIAAAGRPVAILLDTKAVLLLQAGNDEAAANLLKQAIALPNGSDSRFQLHLAVAAQRSGDINSAKQAWQEALALGIRNALLTDYERKWMTEVEEMLAVQLGAT